MQQFVLDFTAHQVLGAQGARRWESALPADVDAPLVQMGVEARLGPFALDTVLTRVAALAALQRWHPLTPPTATIEFRRLHVAPLIGNRPGAAPRTAGEGARRRRDPPNDGGV